MATDYGNTAVPDTSSQINLVKQKRFIVIFLLCFTYFVVNTVFSMLAPFYPKEAASKNVDPFQVSIVFAMYPLVILIFSPIFGLVLANVGAKFLLCAGMIVEAGCTIAFGFLGLIPSPSIFFAMCLIVRTLQGIGAASYGVAGYAISISLFQESVATALGSLEIFGSLGTALGPVVGGALYQVGGFKLPFIVTGGVMAATVVVLLFFLPPVLGSASKTSSWRIMMALLKIPRILMLCTVCTLCIAGLTFFDPGLQLHLQPLGLSTTGVGLIFFALSASYGLTSPIIGILSDRLGYRAFIVVGCIVMGIAFQFVGPAFYFTFSLTLWLSIVSMITLGIGTGMAFTPCFADMIEAAKMIDFGDEFTTFSVISGIINAAFALGEIIGPIIGGSFNTKKAAGFDKFSSIIGFVILGMGIILIVFSIWEKHYYWYSSADIMGDETAEKNEKTSLLHNEENA